MITDEDKERVRQATDFVQLVAETVELRQRGQEFWGCCPFHGEKSPSFKVNPATGLWHCFGCGDGGDVFSYVQRRENLDFPDAIRYLADRAGIELTEERGARRGPLKTRLMEALGAAEEFYHTMLMRGKGTGPDEARRYFSGRGFGSEVCRRWGLGFAPGRGSLVAHLREKGFTSAEMVAAALAQERSGRVVDRFYERVMFPIHDEQGRTIAFGGRIIGPKRDNVAKYVNTRDTAAFNKGKHLFAYDRAKEGMAATGEAIVCEGYTDVIAMHEAGFTNAVAALGTAFRLDHVRLMERQRVSRIICMFDGDAAGQRAAERAIRYLDKTSAALLCVVLPDGQDPMEFLAAHGADALRPILAAARPLMDFVFEKRLEGYDLSAPGMDVDETKRAIREAPVRELDEERPARVPSAPATPSRERPAVPAADGEAPADYVPLEAYDAVPVDPGASPADEVAGMSRLSADERMQVSAEQELLAAIARRPDAMRSFGARIASLSWVDERHEAMAWAMLSTPDGATPAEAVAAAVAVVPDAARILSGGRVMDEAELSDDQKLEFIVDTAELCSCRRRIRQIRGRLRSAPSDEDSERLFAEATELQRRSNELANRLSSVFSE